MRYVLNGPLKEYNNNSRTNKQEKKLTETTLITPTSIHKNKTKRQNKCNRTCICFEAIVLKLIFRYCNILAAGWHQVT